MKKLFFIGVSLVSLFFESFTFCATTSLEEELRDACEFSEFAKVKKLVNQPGIDVNKPDEYGDTPLIIACKNGRPDIVEVLLSLKKVDGSFVVNVNQANRDGATALLVACQNKNHPGVQWLLAVPGIDVNQADNNGETPLLVACKNNNCNLNLGVIDDLLKNGATNKSNKNGETPLDITKGTHVFGLLEYHFKSGASGSKFRS